MRERREKYAFIDDLVPVCTVNGHNSSTGRTLKSQRILRLTSIQNTPSQRAQIFSPMGQLLFFFKNVFN